MLWLALAYIATRAPFVYQSGFPDGDQQHIALGVLDAVLRNAYLHGERLYGVNFSFGYYAAHFALAPLYRAHPDLIFTVMNWSGVAAGLIGVLALVRFTQLFWGLSAAIAAGWCWTFTPGLWELTTFGHPSTIAFSLYLCSLMSLAAYVAESPRWGYLITSGLLFFLALTVRADFLLGAPVFLALPILKPNRRNALGAMVAIVIGTALFAACYAVLFADTGHAGSSKFVGRALTVMDGTARVAIKEAAVWVLGLGPILFTLGVAGVARLLVRPESRRTGLLVLAGIVPSLTWWLNVEGPFRHLLIPSVFLVLAAGLLVARAADSKGFRPVVLSLVFLTLNQLVALAMLPLVFARYPWTYQAVPGERRWSTRAPLGDWFSNHAAATRGVEREASEAIWLATEGPDSLLVLTPAPFRGEFELLRRFPSSYRYIESDSTTAGLEEFALSVPGRTTFFIAGDPGPISAALKIRRQEGKFNNGPVFIPEAGQPTSLNYPLNGLLLTHSSLGK